jgi:hypothetical protein
MEGCGVTGWHVTKWWSSRSSDSQNQHLQCPLIEQRQLSSQYIARPGPLPFRAEGEPFRTHPSNVSSFVTRKRALGNMATKAFTADLLCEPGSGRAANLMARRLQLGESR